MIAIPIIVGATAAKDAKIGSVRIVWFFTWVEIVWLSEFGLREWFANGRMLTALRSVGLQDRGSLSSVCFPDAGGSGQLGG